MKGTAAVVGEVISDGMSMQAEAREKNSREGKSENLFTEERKLEVPPRETLRMSDTLGYI